MSRIIITTDKAPNAIGSYSQAVKVDKTVYLSGQIPLIPESGLMISEDIREQIEQVFKNLAAVAEAAGGTLNDAVKLHVYLTNLDFFTSVNQIMSDYFTEPYPARVVIGITNLPKGALVEIDAILQLEC